MRGTRIWLGIFAVSTTAAFGIAGGSFTGQSIALAATTCDLNSVYGHTENNTDVQVQTEAADIGLTNEWCTAPSVAVAPRSTNDWLAGDNLFETHVNISYKFPDGVIVDFHAESRAFADDRITAGCSVYPAGGKPSPYGCSTSTAYLGGSHGEVEFILVQVAR